MGCRNPECADRAKRRRGSGFAETDLPDLAKQIQRGDVASLCQPHCKSVAELGYYFDKFFGMLGGWQVSAVSENDQFRIRYRVAQAKRVIDGKMIVMVAPHDQRRLANQ